MTKSSVDKITFSGVIETWKNGGIKLSFKKKLLALILYIGKFHWIVELNEEGEQVSFGFKIFGIPGFYYKWNNIVVFCSEDNYPHRAADKRELYPEGFLGGQ